MRNLALCRAVGACAALAACGASLLLAAQPAEHSASSPLGTFKSGKIEPPSKSRAAATNPDGAQPTVTPPTASADQALGSRTDLDMSTLPGSTFSQTESGLRDLGDTDVQLFSTFNPEFRTYFTGAPTNDRASAFIPGNAQAPVGKAYAVERITFPFSRISVAGTTTYAKIIIGEYGLVAGCADLVDPLISPARATIIVNLGAATNSTCDFDGTTVAPTDDLDVAEVNLLTGVVKSAWSGATIGSVVLNTAANIPGYGRGVPVGNGDRNTGLPGLQAIGIKMGTLSGTCPSCNVVSAPSDACVTKLALSGGGGMVWMNWSGTTCAAANSLSGTAVGPNGELGAGVLIGGVFVDATASFAGNENGIWECGEGFWCGQTVIPGLNVKLEGALGNDCNLNGVIDGADILGGTSTDLNGDNVPDECGLTDCNNNGKPDMCDLSCANVVPNAPNNVGPNGEGPWTSGLCSAHYTPCGTSPDCNGNSRVDSCEPDCNNNSKPDDCDLTAATSQDCNSNGQPDECDVNSTDPDGDGDVWRDCNNDLIPDGCQFYFTDCNRNNISDNCDIAVKELNDFNANGAPDVCEALGRTRTLDFERTENADVDYAVGPVDDQPFTTNGLLGDWTTFDDSGDALTEITNAGYADVINSNVNVPAGTCPGTKSLKLFEIASNGTPPVDWATLSPHVFFSDPAIDTVSAFQPLYQEMSLKVRFNIANDLSVPADGKKEGNMDWDWYFGSVFDIDGDSYIVNDYRVLVTFKTMTDSNGYPTEIWVAGAGGYIRTGVDWATNVSLGQVHDLKVVVDLRNQTGQNVTNAAKVYWDGALISTFTPGSSVSGIGYPMDKIYFDQYRNTEEIGFGGTTAEVDCIKLVRDREGLDCSLFQSADCNGDGVCDVYQLATGDLDDNGTLDICEGFCPDCNNNSIIDTVEIAAGSAPDTNANDIIDWCERTTHATSFEAADGFVVGPIDGQRGWHETDGALSEVTSTAITGWPRQGVNYLVVKKNPDTVRNFALLFEPRQDTLGDAEIEIWSWDWGYSDLGFSQIAVEVGDLCTDIRTNGVNDGDGTGGRTPAAFFDEAEWIDIANAGVSIFCNVPNATATEVPKTRVFALQVANAVHGYLEVQGVLGANINGTFFGDKWNAAGLKIMNVRGQFDILWGRNTQTQTTMLANQGNAYSLGGTKLVTVDETRRQRPQRYASSAIIREGGDRQMVIRVARREATTLGDTDFAAIPPFGDTGATQFWFDDFRYATAKDCDADGTSDATYLALNPTYDRNVDGIPDNCQDCDDDCGNFPLANNLPATLACLDPNEKVGNDCNNNGLQDSCDVNPQRPFVNKIDTAGCYPNPGGDGFLPNGQCFEARYGGGSCDLNGNGTPDECEGPDCNATGCLDWAEIEAAGGVFAKCPGGSPALARCGGTLDVDSNGIPDECQPDCNNNGKPDGPASTANTDLNVGNTGGPGSQDSWPYFGNPLQIGDGIPDECCVVCTGLPGGYPWTDQCHSEPADGDLDRDSDVDAYDYKFVQRCASTEPARPVNPYPHPKGTVVGSATGGVNWDGVSCGCADLNGDGKVDQTDLGLLQSFVTGPE
jgi:hypothetical protein